MNVARQEQIAALAQRLGERVTRDAPLAPYAGVGVGGPAELLVVARSRDDVIACIQAARELDVPWRVFGGLTNVLLPDAGLRGLVVLHRACAVAFDAEHRVHVEAGAGMARVARESVQRGLGGLTWAVGLPGSVGGAVVNNAGAFGGEIAGSLVAATVLNPQGEVLDVAPAWFGFAYRYSRLKGAMAQWVILDATFQLKPRDPQRLADKAAEYTARRQRTQPPGKTLGSTFKNPPGDYAGRLIEAAGLKGARSGGFVISEQHANFFINEGNGTAEGYLALITLAQETVVRQFGVPLEPEIEIVEEIPYA